MGRKNIILILFAGVFLAGWVHAETPSVSLTARAIPPKVTLGDELRFLVQVEHPKTFSVVPPAAPLNLTPFEVKKIETSPVVSGTNRVRETFILTLTTFELGDIQIPPLSIAYKDSQGRMGKILTDPVSVKVVSVGKKATDKEDIRPIKGPVSLSLRALYSMAFGALAFCLTVLLALRILRRSQQKVLMDLESLKPPHERVFLELARLREKQFLEKGKVKDFYSELSDILRRYLERRFLIGTLEHTTFETLKALREKNFETRNIEKIRHVLEDADLVKFAKYIPSRSQTEWVERELIELVEMTKPVEEATKK